MSSSESDWGLPVFLFGRVLVIGLNWSAMTPRNVQPVLLLHCRAVRIRRVRRSVQKYPDSLAIFADLVAKRRIFQGFKYAEANAESA